MTQVLPSQYKVAHAPSVAGRMEVLGVLVMRDSTLLDAETTDCALMVLKCRVRPLDTEAVGKVTVTVPTRLKMYQSYSEKSE